MSGVIWAVGFILATLLQVVPAPPVGDALRELFQQYDRDNSGNLGRYELKEVFLKLGRRITDEDIDRDFGADPVTYGRLLEVLGSPRYENMHPALITYSVNKMFTRHDLDGDGKLNRAELRSAMEHLGFVRTDADLDNLFGKDSVTYYHFRDIMLSPDYMNALISPSGSKIEELKQLFDRFDTDKNGYLEMPQLKAIMRELGFVLHDEEIQAHFGDAPVDFKQFQQKVLTKPSVADVLGSASMNDYLRHTFDNFDSDRNGVLEFAQLKAALVNLEIKMSDEDIRNQFSMDTSVVNFDKFRDVLSSKFKDEIIIPIDLLLVLKFNQYDLNQDGLISPEELTVLLNDIGFTVTEAEIRQELGVRGKNVHKFKEYMKASYEKLSRKTYEDVLNDICKTISQGKETFTKEDVVNYFQNVVSFIKPGEADSDIDKYFVDKPVWNLNDCLQHLRQNMKYDPVPLRDILL